MPAKSAKQYGLMQARLHGTSNSSNSAAGPSKEVAKEFIDKTPSVDRKKFAKALAKHRKN